MTLAEGIAATRGEGARRVPVAKLEPLINRADISTHSPPTLSLKAGHRHSTGSHSFSQEQHRSHVPGKMHIKQIVIQGFKRYATI
jgi:hypothetical protein